jgi:(2R)-sulfolactate sulfo-lyase subunit alpha
MFAPIGTPIEIDGNRVLLSEDIHVGHKIARLPLKTGEKILKYGAPIGSLTADVPIGGHVHLHNMKSDYIASHTRTVVG